MSEQVYPEPAAGALILNKKGEIFLMKSPKWFGKLIIPGGHIELGETWEKALKREVREETDLNISNIKMINVQEAIYPKWFWKKKHFIFLEFSCKTKNTKVKLDGREGTAYIWVKPRKALKMNVSPFVKKIIRAYLNENH